MPPAPGQKEFQSQRTSIYKGEIYQVLIPVCYVPEVFAQRNIFKLKGIFRKVSSERVIYKKGKANIKETLVIKQLLLNNRNAN